MINYFGLGAQNTLKIWISYFIIINFRIMFLFNTISTDKWAFGETN